MAGRQTRAASWSRRYKTNVERLASGDRATIAAVVCELSMLARDQRLSAGEQRMLERARRLLTEPPGEGGGAGVREPRRPPAPSGASPAALNRTAQFAAPDHGESVQE